MNKSIRKVKLISRNIFSNRSVLFYIQSIIIYNNILVAVAYYSRFNLLYLFLPTHLSTILLRKHGLMSKSTSKRYYRVVILFSRLFCLVLVSIDYKKISTPADGAQRLVFVISNTVLAWSIFMQKRRKGFSKKSLLALQILTFVVG